jgi:hypothetical protein
VLEGVDVCSSACSLGLGEACWGFLILKVAGAWSAAVLECVMVVTVAAFSIVNGLKRGSGCEFQLASHLVCQAADLSDQVWLVLFV